MSTAILSVITTTDRRGAEIFATDLGRALEQRGRSVQTVALAPGAEGGLDVPVLGHRRRGIGTIAALRSRAREATVVIAHGSTTLPVCAIATAGVSTPFIYRNIGDPVHWGARPMRRLRTRVMLSRARSVVALTHATGEEIAIRYGVPRPRIRVIPRGVPASRFPLVDERARHEARARLSLPNDAPVVLCLGALSPEKDIGLAVEAVGNLPDTHLIVAGDGPERAALEAASIRLAPGRVHFRGTVARPQEVLAAADVVVLPSRTEGLPGVLIEAGLSGLPVVATDVGAVREIVVNGDTGRVVPPGDIGALVAALDAVLQNGAAMGAAARARCLDRFELEQVATAWEELLEPDDTRG